MDEEELSIEDLEPGHYIQDDSLNNSNSGGSNHFDWPVSLFIKIVDTINSI